MLLFIVTYFAGVLTILSPCILPVLPFVVARADQPFLKSGLPLLIGMALTFMTVATLAAVGGGWVLQVNQYGRIAAMLLLAAFGLALLVPRVAAWIARPLVAVGLRLSESATGGGVQSGARFKSSLILGIATGLLWAPCAGPILGLILTGAALEGASLRTSLLLLAYAAGAATSLAAALVVGGRLLSAMKRSLGASEWIRRGLGVALLGGVSAIALGLDTGVLARISTAGTAGVEQSLIDKIGKSPGAQLGVNVADGFLPTEGPLPSLDGAVTWLNSSPLSVQSLRGKVVLIDFWTYSCINCLRSIPYVRAWADKYKDKGFVVIGVHAPEFAFERDIENVRRASKSLKLDYPIAIDNNFALWKAFGNNYWPAHYVVDAQGHIRYHHNGEGDYAASEKVIQRLLDEAGHGVTGAVSELVEAKGPEASSDKVNLHSSETYIGYQRAGNFASPGGIERDKPHTYSLPASLSLNQWGLQGKWKVAGQYAVLDAGHGRIAYRFHARDLHMVLGPQIAGKPIRFRVLIDGQPPGLHHGVDVGEDGTGVIDVQRLYQLVRQTSQVQDRVFELEFLDPGVEAFVFTFG